MYPVFKMTENKHSIFSGKTEDEICTMIRNDHTLFLQVPVKSENICVTAILEDPENIIYIKNPCEKIQLAVVLQIPEYIQYIKNPTESVKRKAVYKSYTALQYITDKVWLRKGYAEDGSITNHEPCYDLIMLAYHQAREAGDEHYLLAVVGDLLVDVKFLKQFKQTFNDPVIRTHLIDYMLSEYDKL